MPQEPPAGAGIRRVAVVGAGAAGLTAVKELTEAGLDVVGYERRERPGGLWVREPNDGTSPAYASLHLNTSRRRTELAAHPMPADWPDYPAGDLVAGYLDGYARRYALHDAIRCGAEVTRVERAPGPDTDRDGDGDGDRGSGAGWLVTADGATERYDAVVVANGHNWDPRLPDPAPAGEFGGEQMHAHAYRHADVFAGRRVLVVGGGNSAVDIAVDASHRAAGPVLLSLRHGVHVIPKYLFGRPADATNGLLSRLPFRLRQRISQTALRLAVGRPEAYGLPAPDRGLLESHPTVSDTLLHRLTHGEVVARPGVERFDGDHVVFADGRRDRVDLVVWATGYRVTIPFLDRRWLGPDPEELLLYKRVFHLDDPTLCFVGLMQSTGAAFPVLEAQSRLAADVLSGRAALPAPAGRRADAERALRAGAARWGRDRRPAMRIDFDGYLAELAAERRAAAARARQDPGAGGRPGRADGRTGGRRAATSGTKTAGKRVIVTGASGTFGRELCRRFTALGARVTGLDLVADDDGPAPVLACDLTDDDAVREAVARAVEQLGGVDVLVNNAGIGGPAPAERFPGTEVRRQFEVNLLGAWRVTAACVPHLVAARGRVVMVSSRMAVLQLPLAAAYGASKRALVAYADALRHEVGTHVGVSCVYPSMVRSPIHDSTARAGLSLEGMSVYEPLSGVVDTVVRTATARRAPRDVATTRRGAVELWLARHLPSVADRIVARTLASRVRSGAFEGAELASGVVARHGTGSHGDPRHQDARHGDAGPGGVRHGDARREDARPGDAR